MPPPASSPPVPPTERSASATGWWLAACAAALVYGTLYPWSGWRAPAGGLLGFASEPWPRWWTGFDVATNVFVYLPFGLLLAVWLARRLPVGVAATAPLAIALAAVSSFALESMQSLLPGRVPSMLDVASNAVGAALGAAVAAWFGRRRIERWPKLLRAAVPLSARATPGLLLLCAWPIAQWYPQSMVFATGDLLLAWPRAPGDSSLPWWSPLLLPMHFEPFAEASGVSLAVIAVGLIVRDLLQPRRNASPWQAFWPVALPVAAACVIKTVAGATVLGSQNALGWLNAAAQGGLVAGAVALLVLASAAPRARLWMTVASIFVATVLFNVAPPNEYYLFMLANWGGAWANFHGLLRALATIWPFAALAWCGWRLRRTRARL